MAKIVTVTLALPYKLRFDEPVGHAAIEEKARVRVSEQLILGAAAQMYPEGFTRKQARLFQSITDALTDDASVVTLDGTEFDFLCDLFLSREAEEKVKFVPAASGWLRDWMRHLESLRA